LSQLELTLGKIKEAAEDAEQAVTYADHSSDESMRMMLRTAHADALHQAGRCAEAEACFSEAEDIQAKHQRNYPLLYSVRGFCYCDLLLFVYERAAWQIMLNADCQIRIVELIEAGEESGDQSPHSKALHAVAHRAAQTLVWVEAAAMDVLSAPLIISRRAASRSTRRFWRVALWLPAVLLYSTPWMASAVSGNITYLPRGLHTRAWLRSLEGKYTGIDSAQADLDEAWEIAERGPMPLFMADIHLHRARLFFREAHYPWGRRKPISPKRGG